MSSNIIPFPAQAPPEAASKPRPVTDRGLRLVPAPTVVQVPPPALGIVDEAAFWIGRLGKHLVAFSTQRAARRMRGTQ